MWSALDQLLCRLLASRKGVVVERFGTLAFTPASVDLEGVTNLSARDRDLQAPVFMLASDFASSIRAFHTTLTYDPIPPEAFQGRSPQYPSTTRNWPG